MALAENLAAAEAAVKYVKSLKLQAMNLIADRISAAGGVENLLATYSTQGKHAIDTEMRRQLERHQAGLGFDRSAIFAKAGPAGVAVDALRKKISTPTSIMQLRSNVAEIINGRHGNCQEQAQIAMNYIYSNYPGVRPLDLLTFARTDLGYDHVWVGIGLSPTWNRSRPDGRNGDPGLRIPRYDLREWGPDAVWCDPWQSSGVAFPIADLLKGQVRNLSVAYKCDTAVKIEDGAPLSWLRIN